MRKVLPTNRKPNGPNRAKTDSEIQVSLALCAKIRSKKLVRKARAQKRNPNVYIRGRNDINK